MDTTIIVIVSSHSAESVIIVSLVYWSLSFGTISNCRNDFPVAISK